MTPNIFDSEFIIDGIRQEMTPSEVLGVCMDNPEGSLFEKNAPVVDERLDPSPGALEYNPSHIRRYLALTGKTERTLPVAFAGAYTRCRIARCLTDTLWKAGHFTLDDLEVRAEWSLVKEPALGDLAALYDSVSAAAEYISGLGLTLASYDASFSQDRRDVCFRAGISPAGTGTFQETDILSDAPEMLEKRIVPPTLVPDPSSWLLYVPFDPADFRMGGSLLRQALSSAGGGSEPQIDDTAYFADCFELVRELSEDGILLSAATVSDGGMITAVQGMTGKGCGASIDVSGIVSAYHGSETVHVLFSEIPGAILQIRDTDFDYIDAEFLLQDVAYFPVGHPVTGIEGVEVLSSGKSGIQSILDSLLMRESAEGED